MAGSNPGYTSSEFTHNFKTVEPKFLIVQLKCLPAVEIAAEACNISPATIFIDCGHDQTVPAGKQSWRSLLLHGECDWNTHPGQYSNIGHKPASLCSTSGTTGVPKAAVATHRFIVAQAAMLEQRFKHKPYEVPSFFPRHLSMLTFHGRRLSLSVYLSSMPLRLRSRLSSHSASELHAIYSPDIASQTSFELSRTSTLQMLPSFRPWSRHC